MRDRHRRAGSAREGHGSYGSVFHFAVEDHVRSEPHSLTDRAEEREQQLEAVAAEVEHRPAARFRPLDEPVAFFVRLRIEPFERVDLREDGLPDLTGREERSHARDDRIEVAVVGDTEGDAMRAARGDHPLALADVHRHRFLAEDVLARLGRGDRLLGVEPHRRGHVDGVDAGIADEILPPRMPTVGAARRRKRFRQVRPRPADRNELATRRVPQRRRDSLPDNVARADEAPSQHVHL